MKEGTDRQKCRVHVIWGATMSHVPPQRATAALAVEPEELIHRLSENLERTISFTEECRWRFPELSAEAEELAAGALALFSKTLRSLHGEGATDL